MKDIEVTIRIQNNQIKERRRALGMTQRQLDRAVGYSYGTTGKFENLASPFDCKGNWLRNARKLADFLQINPEELWPKDILSIKQNVAIRIVDVPELLLTSSHNERLALPPHEIVDQIHESQEIDRVIKTLTKKEQIVIKLRFGFCEEGDHTLDEIAEILNTTRERVRQIEAKALRKLRHPDRSHKLKRMGPEIPFDCWEVLELPSFTMDKDLVRWAARFKIQQLRDDLSKISNDYCRHHKTIEIEDKIKKIELAKITAINEITNRYNGFHDDCKVL